MDSYDAATSLPANRDSMEADSTSFIEEKQTDTISSMEVSIPTGDAENADFVAGTKMTDGEEDISLDNSVDHLFYDAKDMEKEEEDSKMQGLPSESVDFEAQSRAMDEDMSDIGTGSEDSFLSSDSSVEDQEMAVEDKHMMELPSEISLPVAGSLNDNGGKLLFVRWPKYVNLCPVAYDHPDFPLEDFVLPEEEESVAVARLASSIFYRTVSTEAEHLGDSESILKAEASPSDGRLESTANFIQWSDDSWSLAIGKELFDVTILPLDKQHKYIYGSHALPSVIADDAASSVEAIAEQLGHVTESISLKASNLSASKKWISVAESKLKITVTSEDPSILQKRLEVAMADKWRLQQKKKKSQRDLESVYARGTISREFLEEDEDGDEEQQDHGGSRRAVNSSSIRAASSSTSRRASRYYDEDEEEDEDDEDEDYEEGDSDEENEDSSDESRVERTSEDEGSDESRLFTSDEDSEHDDDDNSSSKAKHVPKKSSSTKSARARIVYTDDEE